MAFAPTAQAVVTAPDRSPSRGLRVVYFNYEWDLRASSGAATHITELTRNLELMGHQVAVHHRHRVPEHEDANTGRASVPGVRARLSPYLHEAAALARALRGVHVETEIIRRARPDVVLARHALHQFSSLLAARRCRVPIVFEVNAPLAFEYRRYRRHYRLSPALADWTEARTLARADAVFVVSNALKAHLADRGVPARNIAVIPNGADPTRFGPHAADPAVRARFGPRSIIVGFVGSFAGFHGVDLLRHAMARVLPARSNVLFLMVGRGRHSADLEAACRAGGFGERAVFTGFVPPARVPGLMATMDILLAPYPPESFFYFSPIKLFEYMASGRAILAARVGQIAEVLQDGINGLLYDPADADAFTNKLLQLADDAALRAHLGANARRTAERDYTWRTNAERVARVLAQACDQTTRGAR
jgi:glycosyltransferase involved in cell wall biosynthesis